jgi:hypothetical protein
VAELRKASGGRTNLLSELCGLSVDFEQVDIDIMAPKHRLVAELCLAAGANRELAEQWIGEGIDRWEAARQRPYSGGNSRQLEMGTALAARSVRYLSARGL